MLPVFHSLWLVPGKSDHSLSKFFCVLVHVRLSGLSALVVLCVVFKYVLLSVCDVFLIKHSFLNIMRAGCHPSLCRSGNVE